MPTLAGAHAEFSCSAPALLPQEVMQGWSPGWDESHCGPTASASLHALSRIMIRVGRIGS
jgi:hypothetical protein